MKNIHVLPTDKPSRLVLSNNSILTIIAESNYNFSHIKSVHIYIISDEEIKEGDWCLSKLNEVVRFGKNFTASLYKKIILTTDPDLIADGVQAIDDEFLEWFVKNPSCDEVYIVDDYKQVNQDNPVLRGSTNVIHKYKIIIPKQEPKQLTDLEIAMKIEEIEKEESNRTHWLDELPNMDRDILAKMWDDVAPKLESKQETLEEAAEKYAESNWYGLEYYDEGGYQGIDEKAFAKKLVDFTSKWQAKRSYSEEEVEDILINALHGVELKHNRNYTKVYEEMKEWFQNNKKK
jgi:hypothetical protein